MSDGNDVNHVCTTMQFAVAPDLIWQNMVFYEDVPGRPPWLLRAFLPRPIRSVGDKTRVGSDIRCDYERGRLVKRLTAVERPNLIRFSVLEQDLGVERSVKALEGSYEIAPHLTGTQVRLTTSYEGRGRPRWLWRLFEALFVHALHRHILRGLKVQVDEASGFPEKIAGAARESRNNGAI